MRVSFVHVCFSFNLLVYLETEPFIDRLFAKMNNDTPSKAPSPKNNDRYNDLSEDEEDGDRNFKHRRQRSESREDPQRGSQKRRYDDDHSYNNNKHQRNDDRRNPNTVPMGGHNGQYASRGNPRGMRGGRNNNGMGRTGKPQCRDYNGKNQHLIFIIRY